MPIEARRGPLGALPDRQPDAEAVATGNARQIRHARAAVLRIQQMGHGTGLDQIEQRLHALLATHREHSLRLEQWMMPVTCAAAAAVPSAARYPPPGTVDTMAMPGAPTAIGAPEPLNRDANRSSLPISCGITFRTCELSAGNSLSLPIAATAMTPTGRLAGKASDPPAVPAAATQTIPFWRASWSF